MSTADIHRGRVKDNILGDFLDALPKIGTDSEEHSYEISEENVIETSRYTLEKYSSDKIGDSLTTESYRAYVENLDMSEGNIAQAKGVYALLVDKVKKVEGQGWHRFDAKPGIWRFVKVSDDKHIDEQFLLAIKVFNDKCPIASDKISISIRVRDEIIREVTKMLTIGSTEMNPDINLIAHVNGVYDLNTGKMRAGRPSDLITRCRNTVYNPDDMEMVENGLEILRIITDASEEEVNCLAECLGTITTGIKGDDVMYVWIGTGRNGKGLLQRTLAAIIGQENCFNTEVGLFTGKKKETEFAALQYMLMVTLAEPDKDAVFKGEVIKMITGGDALRARHLYGGQYNYSSDWQCITQTNTPIKCNDTTHNTWDRMVISTFYKSRLGEEDTTLRNKMLHPKVLQAVNAACIWGLKRWNDRGQILDIPDSMIALREEWRRESDSIGSWVRDCLVTGGKLPVGMVLDSYTDYCVSTEQHLFKDSDIKEYLTIKYGKPESVSYESRSCRCYLGVHLE